MRLPLIGSTCESNGELFMLLHAVPCLEITMYVHCSLLHALSVWSGYPTSFTALPCRCPASFIACPFTARHLVRPRRNNYVFHREVGRQTWATAGAKDSAPADGGAISVGIDAISCWFSRLPIVPHQASTPWGAQIYLDFKLTMVLIHGLHGHPDYTIRVGSPAWVCSTGKFAPVLTLVTLLQ